MAKIGVHACYILFSEHFKCISICFDVFKVSVFEALLQLRIRIQENQIIMAAICVLKWQRQ